MRPRRAALASLAAITALLAGGCSSGDDAGAPDTPASAPATAASSAPASSTPTIENVAAEDFATRGNHSFEVDTAAGGTGICVFTEEVATCTGKAPADVPDVEIPPFPKGRPGAATVAADGVRYTNLEGVPPAEKKLGKNQRVEFGATTCETNAEAEPTCTVDENAIHLRGAGPELSASGTVVVAAQSTPNTPTSSARRTSPTAPTSPTETNLDGDYSENDDPVTPGTMCGAASGNTLVDVESGEISCPDAQAVIDEYTSRRHGEGGGNTLFLSFDGWACSSPTAGRSAELRASIVCEGPSGERLLVPTS